MRALILVDIQSDFLPGGKLAVPSGDEVIPVANRLIPKYGLVVATQDWHPADHLSFASQHKGKQAGEIIDLDGSEQVLWPDHCVQATAGAAFASDLNVAGIDHVVRKGTARHLDSFSGFFDNDHQHATGLAAYLQERNVTEIDIVGLATDYCVRATALDACELGFKTRVILEGIRGVELHAGDIDAALHEMKSKGVEIVTGLPTADAEGSVETLWKGRYLQVARRGRWEYVARTRVSGIAGIVALTEDGEIVLVEQFRPPVGASVIELPAGLAGDTAGTADEPLLAAAKRELLEETGYEAEKWTRLTDGLSSPGLTDESITLFLAERLRRTGPGGGDSSESIKVYAIPLAKVPEWLAQKQQSGALADLKLFAGLYFAEQAATR